MTLGPNGSPGKVSQNRIARWMGEPSLPEVFQTHGAGMHGASSGKRAQIFLLLLGYRLSLVLVFCWGGPTNRKPNLLNLPLPCPFYRNLAALP